MSDERDEKAETTIGSPVNAAQLELDIDAVSRRARKFIFEQQKTIDRLTTELKTANADRDDLVDRLCAVAGEHESLARASGEVSTKLLNENASLTAERDQAREQLAKLREACVDVPWMLERAADLFAFEIADVGIDDNSEIRSWRDQSQYLRTALESEVGE